MKILFFTSGMTSGGAERVIATLSNALAARGHRVVIAMLKGHSSEYELNASVTLRSAALQPGIRNILGAFRFYRNVVIEEKPDVVAAFTTKPNIIAIVSNWLIRSSPRIVVSERADPYTRARIMQTMCNALYPSANVIVCQSAKVERYYRRRARRSRTVVIRNPLDTHCIGAVSRIRRPYVLSVGRLAVQKNYPLGIGAFARVHADYPALKLLIYGAGPLQADLLRDIQERGLQHAVLLEGVTSNVFKLHNDAAAFMFTSDFEGYPNAVVEAAASGIPVVSTDFSPGVASEIIDEGTTGFVVPRGDESAVESALRRILMNEIGYDDLSTGAQRVRSSHATEEIVERWLAVFGEHSQASGKKSQRRSGGFVYGDKRHQA